MSKSFISTLVGIALDEGRLGSIDDPLIKYLPELGGSAYEGVTLRHMLRMRTGTSWREDYTPGSDLARHRDLSLNDEKAYYEDFAKTLTNARPPGTAFNYSSLDTEPLGIALTRVTGTTIAGYMSEKLWKPTGMEAPAPTAGDPGSEAMFGAVVQYLSPGSH